MTQTQYTFEVLKLCISLLTPIFVLIVGLIISKKIEKNKLTVLKEKEWQVKWAELFFNQANEFNDNITKIICSLFILQDLISGEDKLIKIISICSERLSEIDWNIRNYSQFSLNYQKDVIKFQQQLMDSIRLLIQNKKGNLEEIRQLQFEYNKAVRNAHSEILKLK